MTGTALAAEPEAARWTVTAGERRWSTAVFVLGLGLLLLDALWNGRGLWFYSDEWNVIAAHHSGHWTQGFNGQWLLVPTAVFWVLLKIFGLFDYLPFRLIGLSCYGGLVVVFHHWASKRVRPAAAALAGIAVAWYSTSWNVVMMPLLMNFTLPAALLFATWLVLDRGARRGDVFVAVFLLVGVTSSNVGLVVAFVVAVEFAIGRVPWRRWWVFLPAAVVWIPWYLFRYQAIGPTAKVSHAVHWGMGLTESYARGFAAGWSVGQWLWLAALTAVLVWASIRRRWNARSIAVLAGLALFVAGASFRAADFPIPVPPDPNWYLWLYSVFVAALLVELCRDVRIPLVLLALLAVPVTAGGVQLHHSLEKFHRGGIAEQPNLRTWFAAADALGPHVAAGATLPVNIIRVPVRDYASLRRDMGSLAPGARLGDLGDEATREAADAWMLENLGVTVHPGPSPADSCRPAGPMSPGGVRLPAGTGVEITASAQPAEVRFRRFADDFGYAPFATVPPHHTVHLAIPTDVSNLAWYLRVDGGATVSICSR